MLDVEKMRKETDLIRCHCTDPNCPFLKKAGKSESVVSRKSLLRSDIAIKHSHKNKSLDSGIGSTDRIYKDDTTGDMSEYSAAGLAKLSSFPEIHVIAATPTDNKSFSQSAASLLGGNNVRPDGTIVEYDYPGYSTDSKSDKKRPSGICSSPDLTVCYPGLPAVADCQVDQDRSASTGEKYIFIRDVPERRTLRSPLSHRKNINLDDVSCKLIHHHHMILPHKSARKNKTNLLDRIKSTFVANKKLHVK